MARNYSKLLATCAEELHAVVVDIMSQQALDEEPLQMFHNIVLRDYGDDPEEWAFSNSRTKHIYVKLPIRTQRGYVIAMHELGHIATTPVYTAPSVETEATASLWALGHLGYKPTAKGLAVLENALQGYINDGGYGKPGPETKRFLSSLHALQA